MKDLIDRQAAIDALLKEFERDTPKAIRAKLTLEKLPSAQPKIIHCKECKYGVQDEYERWYCRGFGCQVGEEDGSGFCSDAERRSDESNVQDK